MYNNYVKAVKASESVIHFEVQKIDEYTFELQLVNTSGVIYKVECSNLVHVMDEVIMIYCDYPEIVNLVINNKVKVIYGDDFNDDFIKLFLK